ncbi:hypothetical protein NECAME_12450 [Necator americanus]|uniref:Uncharacterized protein n=1 Tax=Necator americanus TaxID=51031 RepID=W2T2A3_NECAM|nr:hypothetical protein NECAME_12450 [Necator americanus]ETN75341.1 hypothetical protein NECAME_12450 [Necator americanus]
MLASAGGLTSPPHTLHQSITYELAASMTGGNATEPSHFRCLHTFFYRPASGTMTPPFACYNRPAGGNRVRGEKLVRHMESSPELSSEKRTINQRNLSLGSTLFLPNNDGLLGGRVFVLELTKLLTPLSSLFEARKDAANFAFVVVQNKPLLRMKVDLYFVA